MSDRIAKSALRSALSIAFSSGISLGLKYSNASVTLGPMYFSNLNLFNHFMQPLLSIYSQILFN